MDFYVPPQQRPDIEYVLEPGDLVTHVTLPAPPEGERSVYLKLRDRAAYEFALVSAAVAVRLATGAIASARFALGGVGTRPWRIREAERALVGQAPSEKAFRDAAEICLAGARPQSQNGFKVELAKRCMVHAFKQLTH
jgi:xanthine dehydrogenase YagS FAD-binding subunit